MVMTTTDWDVSSPEDRRSIGDEYHGLRSFAEYSISKTETDRLLLFQ